MRALGSAAQHGKVQTEVRRASQPATREGQAGPIEVARGPVCVKKAASIRGGRVRMISTLELRLAAGYIPRPSDGPKRLRRPTSFSTWRAYIDILSVELFGRREDQTPVRCLRSADDRYEVQLPGSH
jgi:hypothetical protein